MIKRTNRRKDTAPLGIRRDSDCTTPVCQATSKPDPELVRLRQAEERCVSPTAGRWTIEGIIPNGISLLLEEHSGQDYMLVKHRLRPSVVDSRIHRGGDLDSNTAYGGCILAALAEKKRKTQAR